MRLAVLGIAVSLVVLAGAAFADSVVAQMWDAHGCWIDRPPREVPPRRDRDELGTAARVRGAQPGGYVAFTFDDGPSEHTTLEVLDTLDDYDVPATFFVVGWRLTAGRRGADDRIALLDDIVRRGHLIGNHTFKHNKLDQVSARAQRKEIDRTHDRIQDLVGFRPYLFRPPYGRMTGVARRHLAKRAYTEVRWNIDPNDFLLKDPDRLRAKVVGQIVQTGGGVVLLHDTKPATAKALPQILSDLEKENCRRRKARETLIVPVSLHYFIRNEDGSDRPIPDAVTDRTTSYLRGLEARCKSRIDKAQATN